MERTDYKYDVFISHAVEDKLPIANELEKRLKEKGLKVWYSGTELSVGDRLTDSIHKNLNQCRFGVVILSPTYLSKLFALSEFFLLLSNEKNDRKVILPVLYDITPAELAARSTLMAEIFSVNAEKGLEYVSEVLVTEIRKHQAIEKKTNAPSFNLLFSKKAIVTAFLILIITMGGYGFLKWYPARPGKEIIEQAIEKRIGDLQQKANIELQNIMVAGKGKAADADQIKKVYTEFINTKSYYRNEYTLNTGLELIRSKKNVEASMALDMDLMSPLNVFNLTSPDLYRCDSLATTAFRQERFVWNTIQPVTYTILTSETMDDQYQVRVSYENPIRLIVVNLIFPSSVSDTKQYQVILTALRPIETYSFTLRDDQWVPTITE